MANQEQYERIVAALQDAALDDCQWPRATALIDTACEMDSSHVGIFTGPRISGYLFVLMYHQGEPMEECEREYVEDYYPRDERIPRLFHLPPGRLFPNTELYTEQELKLSATYNDFLVRWDGQNQLTVRLAGPMRSHILWSVTRKSRQGDWRSGHIALLEGLMPHVRHAICVSYALANAEARSASLASLLDNQALGTVLLDPCGRIMEANDRARAILGRGNGLEDRDGFLRGRPAAANATLGKLLARAQSGFGRQASGGALTIQRSNGLSPLVVHVSPVSGGRMSLGVRAVPVLVLIVEPFSTPDIDTDLVATVLNLTPAEGQVAVALAEGHTVHDIAVMTHRQESSVRWLLKQIYAKTGLRRQADLVRTVLSLA